MYVSDIVLLGKLTDEQLKDEDLLAGCVAGTLHKDEYLAKLKQAGFSVDVIAEDKEISKTQHNELPIESIKIEATK